MQIFTRPHLLISIVFEYITLLSVRIWLTARYGITTRKLSKNAENIPTGYAAVKI